MDDSRYKDKIKMKDKIYVYIAGPYTHPDPVVNTAEAIRVADKLAVFGFVPFCPHLTLFWHFLRPHEIDFWYQLDLAWLEKCDCVLRLPGESKGADFEIEIAKQLGIPIYYDLTVLAVSMGIGMS